MIPATPLLYVIPVFQPRAGITFSLFLPPNFVSMESVPRLLAYFWSLPTTLIGLTLAMLLLATGAKARWVPPAVEVHGGVLGHLARRCRISAMTLGHVILGASATELDRFRAHEHVHVGQCERWGPFFIPAYLLSSLWQLVKGRRLYRDNAFEKEAYKKR
jgi:hypothetical protein